MIRRIFDGAVELPADRRTTFVHQACAGDQDLETSVHELLSEVESEIDEFEASRFKHPRIGTTIESNGGGWKLLELIGEGGDSLVFRAEWSGPEDRSTDRIAAIKIFDTRRTGRKTSSRFRTEIETLRRLDHPGIVRAFETNLDGDGTNLESPWIAMELVSDPRWITDLTLNTGAGSDGTKASLDLLLEACDAIAQAHARGIVHRDLKPSNLLVGSDGRVRVIDFGIAHLQPDLRRSSMQRTIEGSLLGTPAYMAPEQVDISLGPVSPRTDVYALGVVAFRMIAGRAPYEIGDNLLAAVQAIRHVPPLDLRKLAPETPDSLIRLIDRSLSKRPEDRPTDASVLASEIRATRSERTSVPSNSDRKRSRFMIPAVVAMIVFVAMVGVLRPFDRDTARGLRPSVITVPDDVASIQEAIAMIEAGGRIMVRPGTYEENITIEAGPGFTLESTDGPRTTVIRPSNSVASVLRIGHGVDAGTKIRGITFAGGTTGSLAPAGFWVGGGVYLQNNAVHLIECIFDGNRSTFGGNLYAMNFEGRIERCVFVRGRADAEGGNAMFFRGQADVIDCDFFDGSTPGNGGGIKTVSGWNRFCGCRFVGNRSNRGGGIIHFVTDDEPSQLHIEDSLVTRNHAFEGGGIWGRSATNPLILAGTVIRSNHPDEIGGPLGLSIGPRVEDCPSDLDDDGMVDARDIDALLDHFGPVKEFPVDIHDLDGDGSADHRDLAIMLEGWGPCRF